MRLFSLDNSDKNINKLNLETNNNSLDEKIDHLVTSKQPIIMNNTKKVIVVIRTVIVLFIIISVVTLIYSFGNLSSRQSNLSQGEILSMTSYSKNDNVVVRELKDNALSDWISTRNVTKLMGLKENERLVSSIISGSLPEDEIEIKLASLSKDISGNGQEIEQLKIQYEVALLQKNINKLKKVFNGAEVKEWKSQQILVTQINVVLESLNVASSVWLKSSNPDYGLLDKINKGIDLVDEVQEQFSVVQKYSDMLKQVNDVSEERLVSLDFSAPFANQLTSQYSELVDYVSKRTEIEEQKKAIQALKTKMANTVAVPDFVGKSLKDVKKDLILFNKEKGSNLKISVDGGDDENAIVTGQTPSVSKYEKMKNDGVVILDVPNVTNTSTENLKDSSVSKSSSKSVTKASESNEITKSSDETQHVDESYSEEGSSTTVHVDE